MRRSSAISLVLVLTMICAARAAEPRAIGELLSALEADDTRPGAIRDLEDLGLDAAPAVPKLIQLLDASDSWTRGAAADALGAIGKDAAAAIPRLIDCLSEGELPRYSTDVGDAFSAVGIRAAAALGTMGECAVAPLSRALTDRRSPVRSNAACALEDIGPVAETAVPSLIPLLKDKDELVRERAIWALRRINADAAKTVPSLVECLTDKNFNIRVAATSALGAVRPMTPAALDALIGALRDDEGDVQNAAAEALGKLGDNAIPAIPALTHLLKSRAAYRYSHPVLHRPVAATAARALGKLGPRAKDAMPALLDLVGNTKGTFERYGAGDQVENDEARGQAAIAAAKIAPQSDDLISVLDRALQEDDEIRREVAAAIALIGPRANCLLPTLIRFMEPIPRYPFELHCACAIVVIDPDNKRALDAMLDHLPPSPGLYDDDGWSLLRAALVRAGARSRPAIPVLIKVLADPSMDQEEAARTLALFGSQAESAVPTLLGLLASRWENPRQDAITALQQIASEKSPALLEARKNPDANVRAGVVEVLGHFPGALPRIIDTLNDPSARVRRAALVSLANLGDAAKPAIPQIRDLLRADSRTIREAAAFALHKVEQH
jgi:HEAT repeat protein